MYEFKTVSVDVAAVAQSLSGLLGRAVSDVEAINHLRGEGLMPCGDGWLAQPASLTALQRLLQPTDSKHHVASSAA